MSNIAIFTNVSYPQVGGCEKVVQQISQILKNEHNVFVGSVFSNIKQKINYKDVSYEKVNNYSDVEYLLSRNEIEKTLVYGAHFYFLKQLIKSKRQIVVVLVGLNFSDHELLNLLKEENVKLIVHSKMTREYQFCEKNNLKVEIISNGVDLEEFKISENIRDKYNINNDTKIILNVSNYFPGKGQNFIPSILQKIEKQDYIFVSISSTLSFQNLNIISRKIKSLISKEIKSLILTDINRREVIDFMLQSDIFIFTSQAENSPLVLYECQTNGIDWISANVGNAEQINKENVICGNKENGLIVFTEELKIKFANKINESLKVIKERRIKSDYDFKVVGRKYLEILK